MFGSNTAAVKQLFLHTSDKQFRARRKLCGVHPVGFQRVIDQQLALYAVAGVKTVSQRHESTCHGQNQDQTAKIKTEKGAEKG